MKFETVQIHFLRDVTSVCCHPEILLQWQCNVTTSPHYCQIIEQLTEKTWGRG